MVRDDALGDAQAETRAAALEAGAEDVETHDDGSCVVITAADGGFGEVVDALKAAGLEPANAEVTMHPSTEVELDADGAESVMKLIDHLEDLDDVQEVYHDLAL